MYYARRKVHVKALTQDVLVYVRTIWMELDSWVHGLGFADMDANEVQCFP